MLNPMRIVTLLLFQFPSNGMVFPNEPLAYDALARLIKVSIPFKRDGLSERFGQQRHNRVW